MKIERAVREQTYTLTSIAGPSGSGKTYSALLYARGLVGPEGKVGFIDTENKRSRFYADVAGGFDVIDLDPPFTAQRYIQAIEAFEKAGYGAIVIDSISHEWEGTGGVLEQAEAIEQATKRAGLHCWQKPKAGHKKLMNELLQTRAHLIFCCRVKEKVVQVKGANGKTEIVNEGFVVVQEKSFIYEMTVSMMLSEGDHVPTIQKCPGDLIEAFPAGKPINVDAGGAVKAWSEQGREIDQEMEAAKREGVDAASRGTGALRKWWSSLPKDQQAKLAMLKDTLKSIADASDELLQDAHDAGAGDPGERLRHARSSAEDAQDGSEGFDRDKIARQTGSFSTTPNSDDALSSSKSSDEAGESPSPADTDGDGSAPSQEPSPSEEEREPGQDDDQDDITAKERDILIRYARSMLDAGADPKKDRAQIEKMHGVWKAGDFKNFGQAALGKAKSIFDSAQAIARNDASFDAAVSFFEEMLDAPGQIGGQSNG